jgi:antitoxin (DNA-binding transcriptional repressor) of toxin-antitoxin stability system
MCYSCYMQRKITQRELRNNSGEIMRAVDQGVSFLITRNGVTIAELKPKRELYFAPMDEVIKAFREAHRGHAHTADDADYKKFREALDKYADQDPTPSYLRKREKRG